MASKPPPPSPAHLLRTHHAPVRVLTFSDDNERLYSGDADGMVVVTSTRSLRPTAVWKAHSDGLLGIQEWDGQIITHGRDNKLHVWQRVQEPAAALGNSAIPLGLQNPQLCYSMDVNALNYCRFSLMPMAESVLSDERRALIALPNLVESSFADIWTLPSQKRLHAAIGKAGQTEGPSLDGRGVNSTGIIMSMHLYEQTHPHACGQTSLRLLCAYENGAVTCWGYARTGKETSIEGIGWDTLWNVRLHVESAVMAMAVSNDNSVALTVSADHLIGRYDIKLMQDENADAETACTVHRTKHPGNASIDIRDDGKMCAVGGWDGKIRLYSTKSVKSLGTLGYHKKSSQAVAFARQHAPVLAENSMTTDKADDLMDEDDKAERAQWLAAGSQDQRVSLWTLMDFGGSTTR
ncbi:WD40 repeat-like protein [Daedalea quercina L-15889]|uniref:ASTRA-associated protein 1 n=1 Tax=Daedalea quercina L-15889 TaxID=1314783 RepID=A0A165L636_9APHY|nr:WD40 repeat-like protein [Daedalea quercina L-15889]